MRITHILPAIGKVPAKPSLQGSGGISAGTLSLAEAQSHRGMSVSLTSWTPAPEPSYTTKTGVQVNYLQSWNWCQFYRWDFRWLLPVATHHILQRPNILHVHSDPNLLLVAQPEKRVFHLRTPVPDEISNTYNRLVNRAHCVVCNSLFTATEFKSRVSYPPEKVFAVYNGADSAFFGELSPLIKRHEWGVDQKAFLIVLAGALVPEKGPDQAIQAFEKVHKVLPTSVLAIVGSTKIWPTIDLPSGAPEDYANSLKRIACDLPVKFIGSQSRDAMPYVLAAADLVIVPSVWEEPFGTIVCEAMASGKPVVAYKSGGIVETVRHSETGLLVDKGDIDGLAQAIVFLAENPDLRQKMAQESRARALQDYTWDIAAQKLADIYNAITR